MDSVGNATPQVVERCRCTTVEPGEATPGDWRDLDGDGIVEWCIACDEGVSLVPTEPDHTTTTDNEVAWDPAMRTYLPTRAPSA